MYKEHLITKIAIVILLSAGFQGLRAQDHSKSHLHEDHGRDGHNKSEIGLALAPVYFFDEKELSAGIHFHYTYNFPDTKFGLGLAYEHIFDKHKHNFVGLEGAFRPVHPISVSFTPGMTFEGEHFSKGEFAFHVETGYEFELKNVHLGPVLEFAWHSEGYHASVGVHLGIGL